MEPVRPALKLPVEAHWELVDLVSGMARVKPGDHAADRRDQLNTVYCCSALNKALREYVAIEGWTDNDSWLVIKEALDAVTNPAGDMLALKTLLALEGAGRYPDERRIDGVADLTIGDVRGEAALAEGKPFETYARLRKHYVAKMYSRTASTLNPRGTIGSSPRETKYPLTNIVEMFEGVIKEAFTETTFGAVIEARVAAEIDRFHKDGVPVEEIPADYLAALAVQACDHALSSITALPSYYPETLTLDELASFLRVRKLPPEWKNPHAKSTSLHASITHRSEVLPADIIRNERRAILLGDPGHGKSTVLAAIVAKSVCSGNPSLLIKLPLFVAHLDAKHLADGRTITQAIARFALSMGEDNVSDVHLSALVMTMTSSRDFVLALDGLDEVGGGQFRSTSHRVISELSRLMPGTLLIGSRITGYQRPIEAAEYVLAELDVRSDAPEIARRWFTNIPGEGLDRALEAIRRGAPAQIPLMVGFICSVAETTVVETTSYGLYEQYLHLLLSKVWKHPADRPGGAEVASKAKAAEYLAWCMATGADVSGRNPRRVSEDLPPRWADTATMQYAQRVTGASEVLDLFENDGLLILQGSPAPNPFASHFRWLHRTLHEHLVSRYIVEMTFPELELHTSMIVMAVQNLESWYVPLRASLEMLPGGSQALLLTALLDAIGEGDPGGVLAQHTAWLAYRATRAPDEVDTIWRLQIEQSRLLDAYRIDPKRTLDRVLESDTLDLLQKSDTNFLSVFDDLASIEVAGILLDRLLQAAEWPEAKESWVPSLLGRYLARPTDDWLARLSSALQAGIDWLPLPTAVESSPSRDVLRDLATAVASTSGAVQTRAMEYILMLDTDLSDQIAPRGPLRAVQVCLALEQSAKEGRTIRVRDRSRFQRTSLPSEAIRGMNGDYWSYLFGGWYPTQVMSTSDRNPWAEVGMLEAAFTRMDETGAWPDWAGVIPDVAEAWQTISDFMWEWSENGALAVIVIRAMTTLSIRPLSVDVSIYVDFFRRATSRGFFGTAPEYLSSCVSTYGALRRILRSLDSSEVLQAILSSDPSSWSPDESLSMYDLIFRSDHPARLEDFTSLLQWKIRAGVQPFSALRTYPLPDWTDSLMTVIFNDPVRFGLNLPSATDDLAYWLAQGGALHRYRPRLLELSTFSNQ